MRIEPAHGDHSIVEVVFQLELDSPWQSGDLERLEGLVSELRDELPAYRRSEQGPGLVSDPTGALLAGQPRFLMGVEFAAFRRNGAYEWRVQCLAQTVTVNCLAYTRWKRVVATARAYFERILSSTSRRPIRAITLQFIDEFTLESDDERVAWGRLFALESRFLPRWFGSDGRIWHLHQGWLAGEHGGLLGSETRLPRGQLLEKLHMDSLLRSILGTSDREHVVRIDHLQRLTFEEPVLAPEEPDTRTVSLGSIFSDFEKLHRRNKDVFARLAERGHPETDRTSWKGLR